jgi:urease accessory protein
MKASLFVIFTGLFLIVSFPVHAHTGVGTQHGLLDGLLHPLMGVDHLLVMLVIGLWAAMRGRRALWLLPGTFLMAMGMGATLRFAGITVPAAESWVAFSVLAAGVLVWRNTPMSSVLAVVLVAVFALGHGYVHAVELTKGADVLAYSAGFLLTTALLHGLGITLGISGKARLKIIGTGFGLVCAVVGASLLVGI